MEHVQKELARFRNDLEAIDLKLVKSHLDCQRINFARDYAEQAMTALGYALRHLSFLEEPIHVRYKSNGRAK